MSGHNLDCRWVELSVNVTLARSRWVSNYYITPATENSDHLGRRCWKENHVPADAGPPRPQLSSPGERERNATAVRRVGGVNMLQFCSVYNSPLTVKAFVTLSNLSNKVSARLYCVNVTIYHKTQRNYIIYV